jgi:hypothetical protein
MENQNNNAKHDNNPNWFQLTQSLFRESRGFTKEEAEAHNKMLNERSVIEEKLYDI